MPWTWNPDKDRENRRKHRLGFETAQLVFDDPLAASRLDGSSRQEERWHTVGVVGNTVIFVVHTAMDLANESDEPVGRIISARKATAHERRAYEEGEF